MAGRLPGVGLPPRRRSSEHNNHRHEHHVTYRDSYLREESLDLDLESPWTINNSLSSLDETALKARQRLQKKLGYFFSSSSSNENPKKEGKVSKSSFQKKNAGLGRKILESSWLLGGKKERKICAVCLENFQQDEKVMNLSCSHKYHSACLLPWLAVHPHCPYCRTLVEPLLNKAQPKHH